MISVNELFSGIGSQSAALERLGIDFKVVGIAEIDKYAIKSYEAIHGPVRNYGDISKIEKLDYADFWTYSFPCQDISVAGKQRGINENTRSGLLYEVERLLYKSIMYGEQPKWLMLENVKNLVGKQFKPQFEAWIKRLDELGYNTYWKVLNAKNYGIPQNRERVFAISIRKDIDTGYEFPIGFDNGKRLKDILESEVDEKYYINNEKTDKLIRNLSLDTVNICKNEQVRIGGIYDGEVKHQAGSVWGTNGIAPTVDTMQGGNRQPCVLIPQAIKIGNTTPSGKSQCNDVYSAEGIHPTLYAGTHGNCNPSVLIPLDTPCIAASRGRNPQNPSDRTVGNPTEQRLEINKNGTSNTITTVQKDNYAVELSGNPVKYRNTEHLLGVEPAGCEIRTDELRMFTDNKMGALRTITECGNKAIIETDFRIRKLTPLECWRLMGFTDDQFYKAAAVNSNSQLYKQAGNSICVDVLYYLFKNLFLEN